MSLPKAKRFDIADDDYSEHAYMEEYDDGEYVRFDDYDKLEAHHEARRRMLLGVMKDASDHLDNLEQVSDEWAANCMQRARDALLEAIRNDGEVKP